MEKNYSPHRPGTARPAEPSARGARLPARPGSLVAQGRHGADDVGVDVVQHVELPRLPALHEGPPPPLRLLPPAPTRRVSRPHPYMPGPACVRARTS